MTTETERLRADFEAFHSSNPHVYDELVTLARQAKRAGVHGWGMAGLFEVLRWNQAIRTAGAEFKLNNNHRAFYSRKVMLEQRDLDGFFEVRESAADLPDPMSPVEKAKAARLRGNATSGLHIFLAGSHSCCCSAMTSNDVLPLEFPAGAHNVSGQCFGRLVGSEHLPAAKRQDHPAMRALLAGRR